jgi:molecular chaperone GrpE
MTRDKEPQPQDPGPSSRGSPAGSAELPADERAAALESRCAELEARWMRAQADYQNLRRRSAAELEDALLRQMQPLLAELLLVLDYLDLALQSRATTEEAKSLASGVQMTRTKLAQVLENAGVQKIDASGRFDPALHEASRSETTAEVAPNTILATVRPGFTWQGRILRPARVVVAAAPEANGGARVDPGEE